MIRVAVVEDDAEVQGVLQEYIRRYTRQYGTEFEVSVFADGVDILEDYRAVYDVIFLDVEMKHLDGMTTAERIRQMDADVILIFITNMAQYALKGYKVGALDYIVKPVSYFSVADCMRRAFLNAPRRAKKRILLNLSATETVSVAAEDILYVEKHTNTLTFHTTRGVWEMRGTMRDVEAELEGEWFSRCISGCLVNLRFVERTTKNSVFVGGEELPLARQRRKEFINDLMNCVGGR